MARRRRPALPEAGAPPGELLAFDEAEWADDKADAMFMPGGEFAHPGLLRFVRRRRYHRAQREWSAANGLHEYYLLHMARERRAS